MYFRTELILINFNYFKVIQDAIEANTNIENIDESAEQSFEHGRSSSSNTPNIEKMPIKKKILKANDAYEVT